MAKSKKRVELINDAKETIVTDRQCSFAYTRTTKSCNYNTNVNRYHDRQTYHQSTVVKYQGFTTKVCQSHVRCLMDFFSQTYSRTLDFCKLITFSTEF